MILCGFIQLYLLDFLAGFNTLLQLLIVCAGVYRLNLATMDTTKNKYAVHNIHTDKSYSSINFQTVVRINRTIVVVFIGIVAHKKTQFYYLI